MLMDKQKIIDFFNRHYGDDDYFDVEMSVEEPPQDNSLVGTTFGSATHLTRMTATLVEKHHWKITASKHYKQG